MPSLPQLDFFGKRIYNRKIQNKNKKDKNLANLHLVCYNAIQTQDVVKKLIASKIFVFFCGLVK